MSQTTNISVPKDSKVSQGPTVAIDAKGLADLSAALAKLSPEQCKTEINKLDSKAASVPVIADRVKLAMVNSARKAGMGKRISNTVTVDLWYVNAMVSASNTFNTGVTILQPHLFADFSTFAAVYDIFRVKGIHVLVNFGSSAAINGVGGGILVFDPVNDLPLASFGGAMTNKYRLGPVIMSGPGLAAPAAVTPTGFLPLHCKTTKNTWIKSDAGSGSAELNQGGGWTSTQETTFNVGYLKGFVNALGSSVTSSVLTYTRLTCEFAYRT